MPYKARFSRSDLYKFALSVMVAVGVLTVSTFGAASARAEEAQPIQDSITLELRAETWVTTARSLVQVNIVAAGDSANAATIRDEISKALEGLVSDTKWRSISLNRSQDEAGLERWYATYEARVAESQLAGLADKVKKNSRAGLQFTIASVQFSPELKEIEDANITLRQDIYKQVDAELARLNAAYPGRNFRVSGVQFNGGNVSVRPMVARANNRMMKMGMAEMAYDSVSAPTAEMSVETRMEQSAFVTLSAHAPKAAE